MQSSTMIFKTITLLVLSIALLACSQNSDTTSSLKKSLENKFLIGTALNTSQVSGKDKKAVDVVIKQFNSIVAENCMKIEELQPLEGVFDFSNADEFVRFGEDNNMFIVGHTLVWHSQTPDWFFKDKDGNDVSREVLIERMQTHIKTVVERYKGKIHAWDVVNEAVLDDGSLRKSKFIEIIGEEFIELAFQFAHEADPDAELYYNDYSMAHEAKCKGVIEVVEKLQKKHIRIDGIGMQGHLSMDFPTVEAFEKSLLAFADLGVKVMITELDITVLPTPNANIGAEISESYEYKQEMNPYANGLPKDKSEELRNRYKDFFALFLKHQDKIDRVTMWGVSDADSWRNDWPMRGRTDYPLFFDRNYEAKPIVTDIIEMANQ